MPIDDELLDILCCPETQQPVARAEASVLAPVNAEIEAGRLRNLAEKLAVDPASDVGCHQLTHRTRRCQPAVWVGREQVLLQVDALGVLGLR